PGTRLSKSLAHVPIIGRSRVIGAVGLEDYDREHAFGESDVRLLQTVIGSMGLALEGAQLFDETQRLLKETEQRNAELAVINSIQQGVGAELNFQAIVDLVGDKLREVFATGDIGITWRDEAAGVRHLLYVYEHGARQHHAPVPDALQRPLDKALLQRRPVVVRNQADADALELHHFEGTDMSLSSVFVPMFSGDRFLGTIILENYEREDAFGEAEVRLLSTVAASTGVALENARLFNETQRRARESSALTDVGRDLSSTLDLATVMDRIAAHAKELLAAENSAIFLPEPGGRQYRAIVALGELAQTLKTTVVEPGRGIIGHLIESGRPEFVNDTAADPRGVRIDGTETRSDERLMVVPLVSGTQVEGAMAVWRSGGQPFDARELEFLTGLSLQATIALNNARLFNETREALEQQTATAQVLQVISSSVEDARPVFDEILTSCARLFDSAEQGILLVGDDGRLHLGAHHGSAQPLLQQLFAGGVPAAQFGDGKPRREPLHVADVFSADAPVWLRRIGERLGVGPYSQLVVPIARDDRVVGYLSVIRQPATGFAPKEIALLQTFAEQAVIAIQNARLFRETQEALDHQTASADILRVISASPEDTQPVFDAIVQTSLRLLRLDRASFSRVEGATYVPVAQATADGLVKDRWTTPTPTPVAIDPDANFPSQAIVGKRVVHIPDWDAIELPPRQRAMREEFGVRASLAVPLLRDDTVSGVLMFFRRIAGSFSPAEMALAQSFADQAGIAIENV
ncbi:MAG TPA: GAF domain-containing protein, partial [Burkholderiaceae bacterium]|nr:GAF domain-containing protein [Burkholderiaceae bacterium]